MSDLSKVDAQLTMLCDFSLGVPRPSGVSSKDGRSRPAERHALCSSLLIPTLKCGWRRPGLGLQI